MRLLKTNTATRVTVGPFLDKTDGITAEVALTATNEHLTFVVDTAGVPTLVIDTTATASGGNNDLVHITNDNAGYYDLELTAAQTNYLGRATLSINYVTDHCPVFHEFMIVPANVYDSLVLGTDVLTADVTQWLGTAAATPTTAGVPEVDMTHIAGAAVSTTTAQIGTNIVQVAADATAATNLYRAANGIVVGQAQTGTLSTTQMTTNLTEATNDHYNGRVITWVSGTLAGQSTNITDYTGSTKLLAFSAVTEAPSNNDFFVIT